MEELIMNELKEEIEEVERIKRVYKDELELLNFYLPSAEYLVNVLSNLQKKSDFNGGNMKMNFSESLITAVCFLESKIGLPAMADLDYLATYETQTVQPKTEDMQNAIREILSFAKHSPECEKQFFDLLKTIESNK
jgi:hypothetical protein